MGVDLLYQGEFLADGQTMQQSRRVKNPREAAAYTFGYNYSLFTQRVQDVLTALKYASHDLSGGKGVDVVGLDGAGAWAAAAKAQASSAIRYVAVDTRGFRFARLTDLQDVNFLPGAAKYGDLPALLALGAPGKLWLAGEADKPPALVERVYHHAHADKNIFLSRTDSKGQEAEVVRWLLRN